ncbi:MAG: secretion protein F [Lachnospiraceae bacterium]|nr:secretion protein F [Lachnospiraceae bacterium]
MVILMILFGIFFAAGLFLILADIFRIPTMQTVKVMSAAGRSEKKAAKTLDMWLMDGAVVLSRHLPMNPHKKARMLATLKAAGMNMSPEVYTSYAIIKTVLVMLAIIPCLYIFPLAAIVVLMAAVMVYFNEIGKADEKLREKREAIEDELSRFASTIEQELRNSRDVLSILENYKKNAGPEFAQELDIVCADMRSSSYEAALTRFEARLNSPQLSDIVRGLIGVLRGDDSAVYFQMLVHDFKQIEIQRLKAKAQKIPPKIRKYSFAMLMCFMITYIIIIGYEILKSMSSMM